ncbi:MAG: hypothetical protein KatS3mg060_3102 [Dehalococcoidia bacterium]|nr:MAG: hypothetical protein KatS3mg060_3102 [Dehalococcoidia bacterium]
MNVIPLPFHDPARIDVSLDVGAIALLPAGPGEKPRLELPDGVTAKIDDDGSTLTIRLDEEYGPFGWPTGRHDRQIRAFVPTAVTATVSSSVGRISAERLGPCQLRLESSAGKVTFRECVGQFTARSDVGRIVGEDVAGTVEVHTRAGSIRLRVLDLAPGEHQIRSEVGAIKLELAEGLDIRIEANVGGGSLRVRYPTNPESATVVRLSTALGSVAVRRIGDDNDDERRQWRRMTQVWAGPPPRPPASPMAPVPPSVPFVGEVDERDSRQPQEVAIPPASRDSDIARILALVEAGTITAAEGVELLQALRGD